MARFWPIVGRNLMVSFREGAGAGADVALAAGADPVGRARGRFRCFFMLETDPSVPDDQELLLRLTAPFPARSPTDPPHNDIAPSCVITPVDPAGWASLSVIAEDLVPIEPPYPSSTWRLGLSFDPAGTLARYFVSVDWSYSVVC